MPSFETSAELDDSVKTEVVKTALKLGVMAKARWPGIKGRWRFPQE